MELRARDSIFDELGIKDIHPLKRTVILRMLPPEQKSHGGIWLPPTQVNAYDGPAHLRLFRGQVLAVGPECEIKIGDVVIFRRLEFAWWKMLDDGTRVGWIDETQVLGYVE
jgi:co-chaperonin GroES (HSP10)